MYFENFIKEQENWTFIPGYVDEGISGTSVKKREDFLICFCILNYFYIFPLTPQPHIYSISKHLR